MSRLNLMLAALLASASAFATPPAAPQVTVGASQIKHLRFDWEILPRSNYYELWFKANNSAPEVKFSESVPWRPTLTTSVAAHLLDWNQVHYRVRACNPSGCGSSPLIPVKSVLPDAVGFLKSTFPLDEAHFGSVARVSEDGGTLAVLANEANDDEFRYSFGRVYVFRKRSNGAWRPETVISPDLHSGDRLRARIALSADGNRLALGFPSAGSADDFGMVVIHHRTSSGWVLEQSFIPDFVRPGEIGGILGINATGDTLLMGKYEGGTKLQILHRTGTTWSLVKEIQAAQSTDPSTGSIECANARLSANGLTIARTCMLYENFNEDGKPSIEVFAAPSWTRRNVIAMSALAHQSRLGDLSMDACGDTLAIAASLPDTPPHVTPIVAIYHRAEGEYSRMATLLPHWWSSNPAETRASQFGAVLELNRDGTLLAIGDSADSTAGEGVLSAPFAGASTNLRGAVYVYERSGTSWRLRRLVKPNSTPGVFNVNTYDGFGAALSLGDNGRTLIVGHGNESSYVSNSASQQPTKSGANSGAVWLY